MKLESFIMVPTQPPQKNSCMFVIFLSSILFYIPFPLVKVPGHPLFCLSIQYLLNPNYVLGIALSAKEIKHTSAYLQRTQSPRKSGKCIRK